MAVAQVSAAASIPPLVWELPYTVGETLKKKKKKKKEVDELYLALPLMLHQLCTLL